MNILALTSVYPQPDDNGAVITPTVKYFCEKWAESSHRVIVIHNSSCFPQILYAVPEKFRKTIESVVGHTFPPKASRKAISYCTNGVIVYRIPMKKIIPHGKYSHGSIDRQVRKINDVLTEMEFVPDVIVSHWVNPQVAIVEGLLKVYHRAKTSLVFHNDCSTKNIKRFNLDSKIKIFDAIGCRSEFYADKVMDTLCLKKKPFICYSGIPDEIADNQINKLDKIVFNNSLVFIFVGRLVKYKNVDVIIKALNQKYGDKSYVLHVIGVGAEKDKLENLAKNLNCEKKVIFHGQLQRPEVFELMKKSFCFIMVSNNETFGMVYIEAMLAGCITIASRDGGVDGVIVDGKNGFLSKQGDVPELVATLDKIEKMDNISELRMRAILTACEYRDSKIAQRYLDNVFSWGDRCDRSV